MNAYFIRGQRVLNGLSDVPQEVSVNMAFNLGRDTLDGFNLFRQALHVGSYQEVTEEMLDLNWRDDVGDRALRLGKVMQTDNPDWFNEVYF